MLNRNDFNKNKMMRLIANGGNQISSDVNYWKKRY